MTEMIATGKEELENLRERVRNLEKEVVECNRQSEDRMNRLTDCFLSFSIDPLANINRMTALCGELLGATCALYNRMEGGLLCSLGAWNTPPDYVSEDKPEGHICYDVICKGGDDLLVVRDLPSTPYCTTDPNVARYDLKTYIGKAVMFAGSPVGSLCAVFQKDFEPDGDDRRIITIIAAAISVEEERRQALLALSRSEERYRKLIAASPDGIAIVGTDGGISYVSPKLLEMFGYQDESEVIGRSPLEWVASEDRSGAAATIGNVLINEYSLPNCYALLRKDGTRFYGEVNSAKLLDSTGKLTGMVSLIRDVSERIRTEAGLVRAEKLESIGILAGGIAHDFNNLLGALFGFIELSQYKAEKDQQREIAHNLALAMGAFSKAKSLTQQLLTFSKGGAPLRKTQNLPEQVRQAIAFSLSGSNVSPAFTISDNVRLCNFDEDQLAQVLDNMAINARQAMPLGGKIDVSISNVAAADAPQALPPKAYVRISLRDHGTGIAAEHLPHIFDPFFTTKNMGSGLGLATCYSIIKHHDGFIDVESELGKGATFHIYLPASSAAASLAESSGQQFQQGHGRILVMDDEPCIQSVLSHMLDSLGYDAVTTKNDDDALAAMRKALETGQPFAAAILDLTIPGGRGGKEVVQDLLNADPGIKVIVSSGYAEDPVMSRPGDYGFTGRLIKPYRINDLSKALEALFRNSE